VLVAEVDRDERDEDPECDQGVDALKAAVVAERRDDPRAQPLARERQVAGGERDPQSGDQERGAHGLSRRGTKTIHGAGSSRPFRVG
jgi:hypothetical protein